MPRNLYGGTVVFWEAGSFGRCRHGNTVAIPCIRCGVFHPIAFVKHWLDWKRE